MTKYFLIAIAFLATVGIMSFCIPKVVDHHRQEKTARYVRDHKCKLMKYWPHHVEWDKDSASVKAYDGASGYDCGGEIYIVIQNHEVQP